MTYYKYFKDYVYIKYIYVKQIIYLVPVLMREHC